MSQTAAICKISAHYYSYFFTPTGGSEWVSSFKNVLTSQQPGFFPLSYQNSIKGQNHSLLKIPHLSS